jgi:hypothetical protein
VRVRDRRNEKVLSLDTEKEKLPIAFGKRAGWRLGGVRGSHCDGVVKPFLPACQKIRVGQNPIYTVYSRYFRQGNHQKYSHTRCICKWFWPTLQKMRESSFVAVFIHVPVPVSTLTQARFNQTQAHPN